jgi:hypothetical protein
MFLQDLIDNLDNFIKLNVLDLSFNNLSYEASKTL